MKKLLIVEDDQACREVIADFLNKHFTVFEASNGKVAKETLRVTDVDVVLTDIQMPQMTGIELLEWSKSNKPVPFVMMTGFSMLLETKSAFELGAKGFIAKPFKNGDLLSAIESALNYKPETLAEVKKKYTEVSISDLYNKSKFDFDLYIKLSETKFIRIAYKGQDIEFAQIRNYQQKGVQFLYKLATAEAAKAS